MPVAKFLMYLITFQMVRKLPYEKQFTFYPFRGLRPNYEANIEVSVSEDSFSVEFQTLSYTVIRKSLTRDGFNPNGETCFYLLVKTRSNSSTGYVFAVNANNIQLDGLIHSYDNIITSWDEVWSSKVDVNEGSWSCRINIPLKVFREKFDSLYIYFSWTVFTPNGVEIVSSYSLPEGYSRFDLRFADFSVPAPKKGSDRLLSFTPYFAVIRENSMTTKVGAELKLLKGDVILQSTINPERYSIEADIDQFNLKRRRSLRLEEKRPFFTEGLDLWKMPFEAFYTRSIGDFIGGFKLGLNKNILRFQGLVLYEDTLLTNYNNSNLLTASVVSFRPSKAFENRLFFVTKGDTIGAGINTNFFLPYGFKAKAQFTKSRGSDLYIELKRFSKTGFWISAGAERLDADFALPTAYISYFENTISYWIFSGVTKTFERKYLTETSFSFGYTYSNFLNGVPFERFGNLYATVYPVNSVEFTFGIEPMRTMYEGEYYNNINYVLSTAFGVSKPSTVYLEYIWGENYGNKLSFVNLCGNFSIGGKLYCEGGAGFVREGDSDDQRIYLKGAYSPIKRLYLRFFAQRSSLSDKTDFNLMFQYEFFAGSNIFVVVNRTVKGEEVSSPLMLKVAYEVRF
uniref:DUF5916 domain-containing protein n=1 Tax=candidate division WOR-3 bacterium TaxID=2052148 RepID=A0A7C2P3G7_UNCW3